MLFLNGVRDVSQKRGFLIHEVRIQRGGCDGSRLSYLHTIDGTSRDLCTHFYEDSRARQLTRLAVLFLSIKKGVYFS
jgi:hypothetical protein